MCSPRKLSQTSKPLWNNSETARRLGINGDIKRKRNSGRPALVTNENQFGQIVANSSVSFDGRCYRRRTLRADCAYPSLEWFTAIVFFDYTTRCWSAASKFLDSRPCGDHHFHSSVAFLDMEAD